MTQWGLEAIFNPGKRFDDDERRRLEATREDIGDSSGGKRIDLGSGRVVITPRKRAAASDGAGAAGGDAEPEVKPGTAATAPAPATSKASPPSKASPSSRAKPAKAPKATGRRKRAT